VTPVGTGTVGVQRDAAEKQRGPTILNLHNLRGKDPFPLNINTRTGTEMTRVAARRTPLSQRATRADAEIARRKAAAYVADEENETILTRVNIVPTVDPDLARQKYERQTSDQVGENKNDQTLENAKGPILPLGPNIHAPPYKNNVMIEFGSASASTREVNERAFANFAPLDADGNVLRDNVLPDSPREQISVRDKRNGERKVIAPGAPVPNGPAQSVNAAQFDWLSAQLASVSAAPSVRKRARDCTNLTSDRAESDAASTPPKRPRPTNTKQVLRSVRVELAGPTGVSHEEWTHVSTYGDKAIEQVGKSNAPPSWIKATHASSSRTDPWKGGPVRTASGMLLHAGGGADENVSKCSTARFRPASPTIEEEDNAQ